MTIMCSWCKEVQSEDETEDGEIISHSICEECAEKLKRGYFEGMNFPQPGLDPPTETD
jgi:hypothetical protein